MRLGGLGVIDDASILYPGDVITFGVKGDNCAFIGPDDIRTTLNNWVGQMMNVNIVSGDTFDPVPGIVRVSVQATSKIQGTAGSFRSQIMAALAALSGNAGAGCPGGVQLKDSIINVSRGGGGAGGSQDPNPNPDGSGIPWSTTVVIVTAAALFAFVVMKADL